MEREGDFVAFVDEFFKTSHTFLYLSLTLKHRLWGRGKKRGVKSLPHTWLLHHSLAVSLCVSGARRSFLKRRIMNHCHQLPVINKPYTYFIRVCIQSLRWRADGAGTLRGCDSEIFIMRCYSLILWTVRNKKCERERRERVLRAFTSHSAPHTHTLTVRHCNLLFTTVTQRVIESTLEDYIDIDKSGKIYCSSLEARGEREAK